MTSVLPKAAAANLSLAIKLCADKGTIDASTALAMMAILTDREFAVEFKTKMADIQAIQKDQRATNKEARLQKLADKQGLDIDTLKTNIEEAKTADKIKTSGSSSSGESPISN